MNVNRLMQMAESVCVYLARGVVFDVDVFVAETVPSAMSGATEPLHMTLGTFLSLFLCTPTFCLG